VALSGFTGPLLVAAAYFLTAPGMSGVDARQLSAIVIAPWAVLAGLAGSVLIAAVGGPRVARAPRVGRRQEEAALSDWAQALSSMDSNHEDAINPGGTSPEHTEDVRDSRDSELDEDSYAPPRAYEADPAVRAYASDTGDTGDIARGTGSGTTTTAAPERTSVKEPLWPEQATPAQTKPAQTKPAQAKGRFGRRGDAPKK
jgi:hypothetical protein